MVSTKIFEYLPYYVAIEDRKNQDIVKHLCEQGIQPQIDEMLASIKGVGTFLNPSLVTANDSIDWLAMAFGLLNYGNHWIGTGLKPDWDSLKKRDVVSRIYSYWQKKGSIEGLVEAIKIWGTDEIDSVLPFTVVNHIPLSNTALRKQGIALWSYHTPYGFNQRQSLDAQRRLGVGDRWELSRDYVGRGETSILLKKWAWDNLTTTPVGDMSLSAPYLAPLPPVKLDSLFSLKRMTLNINWEGTLESKELIEVEELETIETPFLSSPQRSRLWDKNILLNLEYQETIEGEDMSGKWQEIGERINPIVQEGIDVSKTIGIKHNFWVNCSIEFPRIQSTLTGSIGNDYSDFLKLYNGNNLALIVVTEQGERIIKGGNYYWKNENEETNYYRGDYTLNVLDNIYDFSEEYSILFVEFVLIPINILRDKLLGWRLVMDGIELDSNNYEFPLSFSNDECLHFSFNINTILQ